MRKTMLKKWQHTQGINIAILCIVSIVSLGIMAESITATPKEESIDGIWKTDGYNLIVEIQNGEFTTYEITTISCLQVKSWYFDEHSTNFNATLLDNGKLAISQDPTSFYYEVSRLSELPDVCQHGITQKTSDPETNFEVFWHTVNENYAFFDLRGVDWQTMYAEYRELMTASTSDEELFGIMAAMLEPLHDKHVTLLGGEELEWDTDTQDLPEWLDLEAAGEYFEAAGELWSSMEELDLEELAQKYAAGEYFEAAGELWSSMEELDLEELAQKYAEAVKQAALLLEEIALRDIMPVIKQNYLKNEMTRTGDGSILYGKLTDTVGYIFLPEVRMNVFDLERDIRNVKGLALMESALDQIAQDFQGLETIILDLRFNLVGDDMYGLAIASRFADQKRPVISREARNGNEFGSQRTFYLEPEDKKLFSARQVICLTSGLTISAGESLTMMLRALPHVTVLGEATHGVLSNTQIRYLPNEWAMTLSNERYYDHEGHCYEVTGVPPDIELPLDIEGFQAGRDNMLDAALELAQQAGSIRTSANAVDRMANTPQIDVYPGDVFSYLITATNLFDHAVFLTIHDALDEYLDYVVGTFTVNGAAVSDEFFADGILDYQYPDQLNPGQTLEFEFDVMVQDCAPHDWMIENVALITLFPNPQDLSGDAVTFETNRTDVRVANPIPEPSTFAFLATGLGLFLAFERRRRHLRK